MALLALKISSMNATWGDTQARVHTRWVTCCKTVNSQVDVSTPHKTQYQYKLLQQCRWPYRNYLQGGLAIPAHLYLYMHWHTCASLCEQITSCHSLHSTNSLATLLALHWAAHRHIPCMCIGRVSLSPPDGLIFLRCAHARLHHSLSLPSPSTVLQHPAPHHTQLPFPLACCTVGCTLSVYTHTTLVALPHPSHHAARVPVHQEGILGFA
jgi:hypothetical protein